MIHLIFQGFWISQYNTQNSLEKQHILNEMDDDITVFHKEEYSSIVKLERQKFIHSNFKEELQNIFKDLRKSALKRKPCHKEITFEIPEHFDAAMTENILRQYFSDLGYNAIPEPRKEGDENKIIFTLT